MLLSKELLKKTGSHTEFRPVKREITWFVKDENGAEQEYTATVYVRKQSFATATSEAYLNQSYSMTVSRICSSIVDEQGEQMFEPEDLNGREPTENSEGHGPICESLGMALFTAVWEVNGGNKKPDPKRLVQTMNSGVS